MRDTFQGTLGALVEQELNAIERDFVAAQEPLYESAAARIFPDALAMRAHARGKQQIIVTNRGHHGRGRASPRSIVERSELRRLIRHVICICADDSAFQKPDPNVLGELGKSIVRAETVVIDDQYVGSRFARNLGATAILVCRSGLLPSRMDEVEDWQRDTRIVRTLDEVDV